MLTKLLQSSKVSKAILRLAEFVGLTCNAEEYSRPSISGAARPCVLFVLPYRALRITILSRNGSQC